MRCPACHNELPQDARFCIFCGQPVSAPPGGERRTEISGEPPTEDTWRPKKETVKAWVRQERNHYEVLEVTTDAAQTQVNARIALLERRLDEWARSLPADMQELGKDGKKRIQELKQVLEDPLNREAYNIWLTQEKHRQAIEKIRRLAWDWTTESNGTKALPGTAWRFLRLKAATEGVSKEELERIVQDLSQAGVLTGVKLAGQEVRTFEELREQCGGKGEPLVAVIWNGELERWLEYIEPDLDKLDDARKIRQDYQQERLLGAQIWLWGIGEKRLVLKGSAGQEEVRSLEQWLEGVETRRLEAASLEVLADGRLAHWLKEVVKQREWGAVADRERNNGVTGLRNLIRQIKYGSGEVVVQPSSPIPRETERELTATPEKGEQKPVPIQPTESEINSDIDHWLRVHCARTKYVKESDFNAIRDTVQKKFPLLKESEIVARINSRISVLHWESEPEKISQLYRHVKSYVSDGKIKRRDFERVLENAIAHGLDKVTARRKAEEYLERQDIKVTGLLWFR